MTADSNAGQPLEPGTVIQGKYRVERLLAEGGMGAVYKARHEVLGQDVAIKFMHAEIAQNEVASQRFLREARAAAAIQSDYVARVTDVDVLEDGTPFMVMEFLKGRDLDELLTRSGTLGVTRATDLIMQALAGVRAAHELGVVHRDLKPSNLFLTTVGSTDRVKVLDFGISKVLEDAGSEGLKAGATTGMHATLGTPRYMSPEQIRSSKDVDARTDVWAMGLILYEALTGAFPFEGETAGEILAKVVADPIAPITQLRPNVPLELADVIHRCLERDRDKRFSTTKEMMVALAPFASKRIVASVLDDEDYSRASNPDLGHASDPGLAAGAMAATRPVDAGAATMPFAAGAVPVAGATAGVSTQSSSVSDATPPPSSGSRWPLIAALGVGGIVIGVGVAIAVQPGSETGDSAAAAQDLPTAEPEASQADDTPKSDDTGVTPSVSPSGEPTTTASAEASAPVAATSAPVVATAPPAGAGPKPVWTAPPRPTATAKPPPPPAGDSSDVLGSRE